jgi:hypothetical protein
MPLITGEKISKKSEYGINPGSLSFFCTSTKTMNCVINLNPKIGNTNCRGNLKARSTINAE